MRRGGEQEERHLEAMLFNIFGIIHEEEMAKKRGRRRMIMQELFYGRNQYPPHHLLERKGGIWEIGRL